MEKTTLKNPFSCKEKEQNLTVLVITTIFKNICELVRREINVLFNSRKIKNLNSFLFFFMHLIFVQIRTFKNSHTKKKKKKKKKKKNEMDQLKIKRHLDLGREKKIQNYKLTRLKS